MIRCLAVFLSIISVGGFKLDVMSNKNQYRIVGGENAMIGELPFQVSLQSYKGGHFCGGSVITLNHVLTAAHCVVIEYPDVLDPSLLRVVGGTQDLKKCGEKPCAQIRYVSYIIPHEKFTRLSDNDIAILSLTKPFEETKLLKVIKWRTTGSVVGENCIASGWGRLKTDGESPTILQKVNLLIFDYKTCSIIYDLFLTPRMICAGGLDAGGKDSCQGDSGGPLVCNGSLTGITSFGEAESGCAAPRVPGVYTEVAKFDAWIKNKLTEFVCKVSRKIIGGHVINISSIPFQVSIHKRVDDQNLHMCSGILLSLKHVLTTAECITGMDRDFFVVAGANDFTRVNSDPTVQSRNANKTEITSTDRNAIGIIFLETAFEPTRTVAVKHLTKTIIQDCELCSVSGWGNYMPGSFYEHVLIKTSVNIQNREVCKAMSNKVFAGNICTFNRGPEPCTGDQGAPLICKDKVVAIVAPDNSDCTDVNQPSIYINIERYFDWIENIINGSSTKSCVKFLILIIIFIRMISMSFMYHVEN